MRTLRRLIIATAMCAGVSARLPVMRSDIRCIGIMAQNPRPRLGRIGQSIN